MQGPRCGTLSWVSRITTWVEGSTKPLSHLGCPFVNTLNTPLFIAKFSLLPLFSIATLELFFFSLEASGFFSNHVYFKGHLFFF